MHIFIESTESKNVILISVDEQLDLSAYSTFNEAASIATNNPLTTAIVVDLGRTKRLFDSGKAMLLALHRLAGHLKDKIYLTNVAPEIRLQLLHSTLAPLFFIRPGSTSLLAHSI